MRIAIASGKGGTGKTTVATNLAYYLTYYPQKKVSLVDCDVEEPNDHLFLDANWTKEQSVNLPIPAVDSEKCTGCGKCGQICQYGAIAVVKGNVLIFPELCHSCGGCTLACPSGALTEAERIIGKIETGTGKGIFLSHGQLKIGEVLAPPLIKAAKKFAPPHDITIIDAPPGTSCPVIAALQDTDFVLLVTEPTPFGLNDLILAVDMVRELDIPFAVGINRSTIGDRKVWDYCEKENIPIFLEIPNDRKIAEAYSRGTLILEALPQYVDTFAQLANNLEEVLA